MEDIDTSRILLRQETFNDNAIEELAKTRAQCAARLQFGRCVHSDCASCTTGQKYNTCYAIMNDYDKMRTRQHTSKYYGEYIRQPEGFMSYSRLKRHYFYWLVLPVILIIILIITLSSVAYGDSLSHHAVVDVLHMTRLSISDINNDGEINCVDYAITYKLCWDSKYPKRQCLIVRNYNPHTNWHHLFVKVFIDNEWVYIEPMSNYYNTCIMSVRWKDAYDAKYNISGETEYWLGTIK